MCPHKGKTLSDSYWELLTQSGTFSFTNAERHVTVQRLCVCENTVQKAKGIKYLEKGSVLLYLSHSFDCKEKVLNLWCAVVQKFMQRGCSVQILTSGKLHIIPLHYNNAVWVNQHQILPLQCRMVAYHMCVGWYCGNQTLKFFEQKSVIYNPSS